MTEKQLRIVVIGIGSESGRGILADIMGSPEFSTLNCTLVLVDINAQTLDRMYRFGQLLKSHFGAKWRRGRECNPVPSVLPPEHRCEIDSYVSGDRPLDDAATHKSAELAIPTILGIELDRGNWECAVNVPNDGGYVENMDRGSIVEVPAIMDKNGVHPQKVGSIPDALAAFCNRQVAIQKLLVDAYAKRSRNLLLQTLLLDPVVDSVKRAEAMMDDMLALQKDFLPEFS